MSRYRSRQGLVSSRILDEEAVLLNHENNHCYALNETGTMAWGLLNRPEGADLAELQRLWTHPQPDDLQRMLDHLLSEGLLEPCAGPGVAEALEPRTDFQPFRLEKYGTLEQLILSGE